MQDILLSSKEILYIASLCDADEFVGIEDGFYGMDDAEIVTEINSIKVSLTNKGFADMDFNGNFIVKDEIKNIIEICAVPDVYISFDKTNRNNNYAIRYYQKDSDIIGISKQSSLYCIKQYTYEEAKKQILSEIQWFEYPPAADKGIVIDVDKLNKIKSLSEFDNPKGELIHSGCSETEANLIYSGLSGDCDFCSISRINYLPDGNELKSLMFINASYGLLKLRSVTDEEKELVEFAASSKGAIIEKIDEILFLEDASYSEGFI